MERLMFAITGAVFAAIYLVSVIIYGGPLARDVAILAAMLACYSQFIGQDSNVWKASIYVAYAAFIAGLFSYFALIMGH